MISVYCPVGYLAPVKWVLSIIFDDFFDIPFRLEEYFGRHILFAADGRRLHLPHVFLQAAANRPPESNHVPKAPLQTWSVAPDLPAQLLDNRLPVLFGEAGFQHTDGSDAELKLDVIGSLFFMLSRYEEVASSVRDFHGRFPGKSSLAVAAGFLDRPIVDEYVEVLWCAMQSVWPGLQRRRRQARVWVSCDVDEPYERWIKSPSYFAKGMAGALLRRRSLKVAGRRIRNAIASRVGDYRFDPNWCFDWYLDACEKAGRQATMFFIAREGRRSVDAAYSLQEPRIQSLLKQVDERGHKIGLHGSYESYLSASQLAAEREDLLLACHRAGVQSQPVGNRQHFLRWTAEQTPDHLARAGFDYDASGGYSDAAGFRFGTAYAFPMWSWQTQAALSLLQRPLVVMEGSVFPRPNEGLSEAGVEQIVALKHAAMHFGGDFSLLWHNSNLSSEAERAAFLACIK